MTSTRFYKRPTVFRRRVYDPFVRLLIRRLGFVRLLDWRGKDSVQLLSVRGRRTGKWHQRPVGVCVHNDNRHLVGFYGYSDWAMNLKAGSEATLESRGTVQPIRAVELAGGEKVEFLRWLVGRYRFFARAWLKVNPRRLTDEDLMRLVRNHPVFRVELVDSAG
jgi:deazaflavin-dependent oxidoreductase (nitroreductase family)